MSTATAADGEVPTLAIMASVLTGVAVAIGAFAMTFDVLLSLGAYIITACICYSMTWVI